MRNVIRQIFYCTIYVRTYSDSIRVVGWTDGATKEGGGQEGGGRAQGGAGAAAHRRGGGVARRGGACRGAPPPSPPGRLQCRGITKNQQIQTNQQIHEKTCSALFVNGFLDFVEFISIVYFSL